MNWKFGNLKEALFFVIMCTPNKLIFKIILLVLRLKIITKFLFF